MTGEKWRELVALVHILVVIKLHRLCTLKHADLHVGSPSRWKQGSSREPYATVTFKPIYF